MKKVVIALVILSGAVLSFWAGGRYRGERPARTVLQGEPTFADTIDESQDDFRDSSVPGAVKISPERQQLIGVKIATVDREPMTYNLRLYGKVVADETKIYRLNASTDSWIRELSSVTTGSIVRKNQILAEALAPAYYNAQLTYVLSLDNIDRIRKQLGGEVRHQQRDIADNQIRMAVQSMQVLGISDAQIEELAKTRKAKPYLQVRAPANGVVLGRNITLNQWFKSAEEFYTIADIEKVWVYADVYEDEAMHMSPGMSVAVKHAQMGRTFNAEVGEVLPLFDPAARTLKVRIDVENPRYDLRPDMFVDVEIPITMPPSIHVPADAVLDSGTKAVVYIDKGNGTFEPRRVKTGWNLGGQVEIAGGLMSGEKIVVSGNFLIDSESRMAMAAWGTESEMSDDKPVHEGVAEKENGTDWAAILKEKAAASKKSRAPVKTKRDAIQTTKPQAAGPAEENDSAENREGPYPFPGAQYLGTVPREPAPAEGEPPKDRLPPRQFEIPAAPPIGTRLK